jgi:ribose 5-phosphate isomerase A
MIVIADDSKLVARLGRYPLPIELVAFGLAATTRAIAAALREAGCNGALNLRRQSDGLLFVTDEGHLILDASLGAIPDAELLARLLAGIPGVVEHGLFIGLARRAILAGHQGVRVIERA